MPCKLVDLFVVLFLKLPDLLWILWVCIWYGFLIFQRKFAVKPQNNALHCPPLADTCPKMRKNADAFDADYSYRAIIRCTLIINGKNKSIWFWFSNYQRKFDVQPQNIALHCPLLADICPKIIKMLMLLMLTIVTG